MFQSLFIEFKSDYSDNKVTYTDRLKSENRVSAAAISDDLSAKVRLPHNDRIFTAE